MQLENAISDVSSQDNSIFKSGVFLRRYDWIPRVSYLTRYTSFTSETAAPHRASWGSAGDVAVETSAVASSPAAQ